MRAATTGAGSLEQEPQKLLPYRGRGERERGRSEADLVELMAPPEPGGGGEEWRGGGGEERRRRKFCEAATTRE